MKNTLTYNKLVRDKIPEIITARGQIPTTRILNDDEYSTELNKKLQEEANELIAANTRTEIVEEMADVMEVLNAIATQHKIDMAEVETARKQKALKRGAFADKIFLSTVDEE